jgi:methylmalonyl-CoA mutase
VTEYQKQHSAESQIALAELKRAALAGENIFAGLMVAARSCSLFQMTQALYEVGGQYRRNL